MARGGPGFVPMDELEMVEQHGWLYWSIMKVTLRKIKLKMQPMPLLLPLDILERGKDSPSYLRHYPSRSLQRLGPVWP